VISSLAKRLENLLFSILYTSFGVWPKNNSEFIYLKHFPY
jgi:hypothetical protein